MADYVYTVVLWMGHGLEGRVNGERLRLSFHSSMGQTGWFDVDYVLAVDDAFAVDYAIVDDYASVDDYEFVDDYAFVDGCEFVDDYAFAVDFE